MRQHLPVWIVELSKLPRNEVDSAEFDNRVRPYAETDVCTRCKVDAAFEVQERLKAYNKRFINREASPYLTRLGGGGHLCTCKRRPAR
jgi:hypothetical protein